MSDNPSFDDEHLARFVSERTGGFHRGPRHIMSGGEFSHAEFEKLQTIKTWQGVRGWLRARAYDSRPRLDAYVDNNPERVKAAKIRHDRKARERNYLANEFVAVDFEGQDYLGNAISRLDGKGGSIPYDDHRLFLGGASSSDQSREPEWLTHPETTDRDKRPLDPRAVLDWLVNLPSKFSDGAIFVMYSFSYDVTHILRHLRFDKAWQIFLKRKNTTKIERSGARYVRAYFAGSPSTNLS
jgi:hypothetical protein